MRNFIKYSILTLLLLLAAPCAFAVPDSIASESRYTDGYENVWIENYTKNKYDVYLDGYTHDYYIPFVSPNFYFVKAKVHTQKIDEFSEAGDAPASIGFHIGHWVAAHGRLAYPGDSIFIVDKETGASFVYNLAPPGKKFNSVVRFHDDKIKLEARIVTRPSYWGWGKDLKGLLVKIIPMKSKVDSEPAEHEEDNADEDEDIWFDDGYFGNPPEDEHDSSF